MSVPYKFIIQIDKHDVESVLDWLLEQNVQYAFSLQVLTEDSDWYEKIELQIEFINANDAMIFKLTWV